MTTIILPQFPDNQITLSLFTNVQNSSQIRAGLTSSDHRLSQLAVLDATTLVSTSHVLAAVSRAVRDFKTGHHRTRTINSEIVFAMSGSNNIADALRRFGVKDESTALLVVQVCHDGGGGDGQAQDGVNVEEIVDGTKVDVTDEAIAQLTNLAVVKKNYKLPQTVSLTDTERLASLVVGAVSMRGYL
ncbi:kinase binding protein CGI-121-domain-containing protein [Lipomyces japonicus]|uniref:kinase binding protein CGI-121-domain-containing protein n=1 Tax=Lipomyces japonicus TaxID=56871 RepID=UPI0034CF02C9